MSAFVVGKRGGIAEFREADGDPKVRKTDAAMLTLNLGVDESTLTERRFSCWVAPAEYGVVRSDFKLIVVSRAARTARSSLARRANSPSGKLSKPTPAMEG
ncbi:hypothetical protein KRMM14A1004_00640 [Krasilnikovia sp. MM14-A1004]